MDIIFINKDKKAKLICPACQRQWEADVSKYYDIQKQIKLKINCKCGHSWSTILEKRQHFRRSVKLMGSYKYTPPGRSPYTGTLEVLDISLKGLKIKLDREWPVKRGESLEIEFRLDNQAKKLLKRQVVIRNIEGRYIGVAFRDINRNDPDIGFYLL